MSGNTLKEFVIQVSNHRFVSKAQSPNCVHISFLCASQCSCRAVCREHKKSAATGGVRSYPGPGLTLDTSAQLLFCSVDLSVVCFVVTAGSQAGYKWGERVPCYQAKWWRDGGGKPRNNLSRPPPRLLRLVCCSMGWVCVSVQRCLMCIACI